MQKNIVTLNRVIEWAKCDYYNKMFSQSKHNIGKIYEKISEIRKLKSKACVFFVKLVDKTMSSVKDLYNTVLLIF